MSRRQHPYLHSNGVIPFAHRGGAGDLPENTLPAFAASVAMGYRHLETDAHATTDDVVVAFHDERLDRVTDGSGAIAELRWSAVAAAEAGFDHSPDGGRTHPFRGRGLRVQQLAELLETFPQTCFNIDAKSDAVVAPLAALLLRMDVLDRVCVGSFSDARITRMRRLCGARLCTAMGPRAITAARLAAYARVMPRLRADCLQVPVHNGRVRIVDRSFVVAAHRAALQVHVWTIDERAEMEALLDLGVDGLMTDRPAVLRDVLAARGLWPPY